MTVVALPVPGNKFRLYVQHCVGVKPVVAGARSVRGNPLPSPLSFATIRIARRPSKDAGRLQAYIDREHKTRYAE